MAYPHSFELYQWLATGSSSYPQITPHLCSDPRTCVRQQLVDRAAGHHFVADHPERGIVKRLRLVLRHRVERGRLGHQHPAPVNEAHDVDMPGRDLERQVQFFRGAPSARRLDDLLEHAPVHRELRVTAVAHDEHRNGAALRDAREHLARSAVRRPQRTADPAAENDRWPHHSSVSSSIHSMARTHAPRRGRASPAPRPTCTRRMSGSLWSTSQRPSNCWQISHAKLSAASRISESVITPPGYGWRGGAPPGRAAAPVRA